MNTAGVMEAVQTHALLFSVAASVALIALVIVGLLLVQRAPSLNWYEQNILEMASHAEPRMVRMKLGRKQCTTETMDSELDTDTETGGTVASALVNVSQIVPTPLAIEPANRRESRMKGSPSVPGPAWPKQPGQPHLLHAMAGNSRSRSNSAHNIGAEAVQFTVPRHDKHTPTMFGTFDATQINRELYEHRQDSCASSDEPLMGECGTLNLCLSYDQKLSLLTVKLVHARELTSLRGEELPNPYFRVTLSHPQPSAKQQVQQGKVYKRTDTPELTDEFFFDIPPKELGSCKLEMMVYDYDQCSVDDSIGYCWLSLRRLAISTNAALPTSIWAEILPVDCGPVGQNNHGELLLSITYLQKVQRLTVNIFKARNLLQAATCSDAIAAYVRVTLNIAGKRHKKKKTGTRRGTTHPAYNEALVFNIPKNSLCDITLEIEVHHDGGTFSHDRLLGSKELRLHEYKDLWRAMIHGENTQARWYPLTSPADLQKEKENP